MYICRLFQQVYARARHDRRTSGFIQDCRPFLCTPINLLYFNIYPQMRGLNRCEADEAITKAINDIFLGRSVDNRRGFLSCELQESWDQQAE